MLEVQNLSVTARNGTQLLKQISFQIEIGEAVGLTGQSGAGKTTLLKALLGILSGGCQVSGGTIQVDGQSLWALSPRKRRELCGTTLGFIPQNPMTAFDPRLKLGRQMEETLRLRTGVSGKEAVEQAEALLAELGLSQPRRVLDSYPAQLSGGMLQRAAAALLMALHPKYIFAGASGEAAGNRRHPVYLPRCCRTPRPLRDGLCDGAWNADRTGNNAGASGTPKTGVDQGICRSKPPGEQGGMDMDGLIAEHISKTYAGAHGLSFAALRDVSIHLEPGSFTSLVGESGSGKSTLARLLVGLEPPDQGTISLDGEDTSGWSTEDWRKRRTKLQAVFQDASGTLNPMRSVRSNVEEAMVNLTSLSKRQRRERIGKLMELTHMEERLLEVPARQLSGGEQRRLSLVRAMSIRPKYLVLDEVLSGLDLISADAVMRVLEQYHREFDCAFLLITHDMDSAYRLSDTILTMQAGQIVRVGIKQ